MGQSRVVRIQEYSEYTHNGRGESEYTPQHPLMVGLVLMVAIISISMAAPIEIVAPETLPDNCRLETITIQEEVKDTHVEKVVCETEFRPSCTIRDVTECRNVSRPLCTVEERMECEEASVSKCELEVRLGPGGEEEVEVCRDIPIDDCHLVKEETCQEEGEDVIEECEEKEVEDCEIVPHEECHKVTMETPRIEDKKVQQLVCDQDNEVGDLEIGNTLEEAASQEDEESSGDIPESIFVDGFLISNEVEVDESEEDENEESDEEIADVAESIFGDGIIITNEVEIDLEDENVTEVEDEMTTTEASTTLKDEATTTAFDGETTTNLADETTTPSLDETTTVTTEATTTLSSDDVTTTEESASPSTTVLTTSPTTSTTSKNVRIHFRDSQAERDFTKRIGIDEDRQEARRKAILEMRKAANDASRVHFPEDDEEEFLIPS